MKDKFNGVVQAKPDWVLRRRESVHDLAKFLERLGLSGHDTADWVLEQIYFCHEGPLLDQYGEEIDINDCFVEEQFGEDPRRTFNAIKQFGKKMPAQRVQKKLILRYMYIDIARSIYEGAQDKKA